MTTTPTEAQMKLADVTDADRDAAAELAESLPDRSEDIDMDEIAEAFARHRLATEARAQGLVEAERERCAQIAESVELPEDYIWSDSNIRKFKFGAEEAAAAIRNQHSQHGGDGKGEIECTLWKK